MAGVIVTGAFGVLGRAVVAELRAAGMDVAAVDIAPAPGTPVGSLDIGGIDLLDEEAVSRAFDSAADQLGGLTGLVNVAGGFVWEKVDGGSAESWDRMYRMNLQSCATACRTALPHLLLGGGAIVNVGAAGALQPAMGMAPYAASKAGVLALTQSLAEEVRDKGVRVNAVLPTIIDTPTNRADMPGADTRHWVRPQAAARVIAFLLGETSATVTGAAIPLSLAG